MIQKKSVWCVLNRIKLCFYIVLRSVFDAEIVSCCMAIQCLAGWMDYYQLYPFLDGGYGEPQSFSTPLKFSTR
jgi:hypothetical protein